MKKRSPSAVLMQGLREQGWLAQVVERWIPGANVRKDLYGFIDIVAISPSGCTWGVQVTTDTHINERLAKIKTECLHEAVWLMLAGWRLSVEGLRPDGSFKSVEIGLEELFDE